MLQRLYVLDFSQRLENARYDNTQFYIGWQLLEIAKM